MPSAINPHRRFFTLLEAVGARRSLPGSTLWVGKRRGHNPQCAHITREGRKKWDADVRMVAFRVTNGGLPCDRQFDWREME